MQRVGFWRFASGIMGITLMCSSFLHAEEAAPEATGSASPKKNTVIRTRYKKSKSVDFDAQSIDGKLRRPETSLIEASETPTNQGILRLRENFLDHMAVYAGESVK